MQNIVDRLGITEILSVIAPGIVLLAGIALWWVPDFKAWVGPNFGAQPTIVGLFVVIVAYSAGLVLRTWTLSGGEYYIQAQAALKLPARPGRRALRYGGFLFLLGLHWIPGTGRRRPRSEVERMMKVSEVLSSYETIRSLYRHPLEILHTYRLYLPRDVQSDGERVLDEANLMHRRLLFLYGMAGALLAVGILSAVRLAVGDAAPDAGGDLSNASLAAITGIGITGNFLLRYAAARLWISEVALTLSLVET